MEPTTFYYSKGTGIFYFVALLSVTALSFWALLSADLTVGKRIVAGIILPGSIYLAYSTFKDYIKPAFNKRPALIMNEKGIYIEESGIIISWSNINKVKMDRVGRQGDWIFIYIIDKQAISAQLNKVFNSEYINIVPFRYAGGFNIFDTLKTFCNEYSPGEVMFSRAEPETWPSEG